MPEHPRELPKDLVVELIETQLPSGAFPSAMVEEGVSYPDENGFVTAQILRALGPGTSDERLAGCVNRALDFLGRCEAPGRRWAYCFWPEEKRPPRLPTYPADADDSAVIPMELARHRRRDRESLLRTVLHVLIQHRVLLGVRPPAVWVREGVFWTWLDRDFGYNLVDCTVNANVVALMAAIGATHLPGYAEACAMIDQAIVMAHGDPHLTRLLSPYYAHPVDLLNAVRCAVAAGSKALEPSLERLCVDWGDVEPDEQQPVFSSAYGRVVWRAPLLQRVRRAVRH